MRPFRVGRFRWWFRDRVAILGNNAKVFCIIPSGDVALAERIAQLLNGYF